ncbi:MAG: hypothetical protein NTY38_05880, partial [Acidobacteria bacterium]|nr:hypothetical protein [Acidobacteriota bacterium]
ILLIYCRSMGELRLGDVIDDYCVKCRRITNHAIVSIVNSDAAKVRCRTCYSDHDYRHEIAPPTRKELKKAELYKEVLASMHPATAPELAADSEIEAAAAADEPEAKASQG